MTEFAPYAKDNLLFIVVFFIAVAQALTILLTIRREKDVKELHEFVHQQRLHNVELRAWLAGNRSAARHRLNKTKREISEPPARALKASNNKSLGPHISAAAASLSRTAENEAAAQAMKVMDWQRDILAGLRAGLKGSAPQKPVETPSGLPDSIRPDIPENALERTEKAINLLKEETDRARENAATLHATSEKF